MTTTTPTPTVWAGLSYVDAPSAIRFLVDVLGFTETLVVPGENGREIVHAELRWPEGGGVMLGSHDEANELMPTKPGMSSVYVVTDDPDRVHERCVAAGAEIAREMREEDYGSRGFVVRDPEGGVWSFGTYRGAPEPAAE
ncbi:VOC family protein [Actinopolymorpha pittospori]